MTNRERLILELKTSKDTGVLMNYLHCPIEHYYKNMCSKMTCMACILKWLDSEIKENANGMDADEAHAQG